MLFRPLSWARRHFARHVEQLIIGIAAGLIVAILVSVLSLRGVIFSGGDPTPRPPSPPAPVNCDLKEKEPNNDPESANIIDQNCVEGLIVGGDTPDTDYYQLKDIRNEASTWVNIGSTRNFRAFLFGPSSTTDLVTSTGGCTNESWFGILTNSDTGGIYYLEIKGCDDNDTTEGTYTVGTEPRLERSTQDDGGTDKDAGDTPTTSMCFKDNFQPEVCSAVTNGGEGEVGSRDPDDYYRFEAGPDIFLKVTYYSYDVVDIFLSHVDTNEEPKKQIPETDNCDEDKNRVEIDFSSRPPGIYLLRISTTEPEPQMYAVAVGPQVVCES